jgi:hypothetical protein
MSLSSTAGGLSVHKCFVPQRNLTRVQTQRHDVIGIGVFHINLLRCYDAMPFNIINQRIERSRRAGNAQSIKAQRKASLKSSGDGTITAIKP